MTLDQIIRNVVYNEDVRNLLKLKQIDLTHPYGEIIQFQIDECVKKGTSIAQEGFQIGEPFDGDIENAPILFLSSNPAFEFDEVSPRYFADSGKIFKPAHTKEMSFDEIKTFLKTRIQKSPARYNKASLHIPLRNGGTKAVPYWGCVRNNTELLLPSALKAKWTKLTRIQKAGKIMQYAVCMEIVPFRSNKEKGVDNAKDTCWNKFTTQLLELSGASVIVLVGDTALGSFVSNVAPKAGATLAARQIYHIKIGDKDRLVVNVKFAQGKMRRFEQFFNNGVINQLKNAVDAALK